MLKLRETGYPSKVIVILGGKTGSFNLKLSHLPLPNTYILLLRSDRFTLWEFLWSHIIYSLPRLQNLLGNVCLISNIFSSLANSTLLLSLLYPLCLPILWLARSYSIWDTWLFGPRLSNLNSFFFKVFTSIYSSEREWKWWDGTCHNFQTSIQHMKCLV